MIEEPNNLNPIQLSQTEESDNSEAVIQKRPFVEPEISSPVDVLEATTFFVGVDSGTIP